jgi:CheY-like chemotaxis protein
MQILIVDDSADWRGFFETVPQTGGLEGIVLESTAEATIARLHREDPSRTDLILMDISLPGIDGLDAGRSLP